MVIKLHSALLRVSSGSIPDPQSQGATDDIQTERPKLALHYYAIRNNRTSAPVGKTGSAYSAR
ncbi:hypothetical protein I2750_20670 [Bacillus sp. PR5]|nr:hypothetical protein [Bacillus sp. PR5]